MRRWAPDPIPEGMHLSWARADEVPRDDAWLSAAEREALGGMTVPKRVGDWRLGRWVAKSVACKALGADLPEACRLEILAENGGAPRVCFSGSDAADLPRLSLSHSRDLGFAAAWFGDGRVGCDVEAVEPRTAEFVATYFTAVEQQRMAESDLAPEVIANLLWSAKESALKALGQGLRMDTLSVEVSGVGWPNREGHWAALEVTGPESVRFEGAWRHLDGFVWTVLVGPVAVEG